MFSEEEQHLNELLDKKDQEIAKLRKRVAELEAVEQEDSARGTECATQLVKDLNEYIIRKGNELCDLQNQLEYTKSVLNRTVTDSASMLEDAQRKLATNEGELMRVIMTNETTVKDLRAAADKEFEARRQLQQKLSVAENDVSQLERKLDTALKSYTEAEAQAEKYRLDVDMFKAALARLTSSNAQAAKEMTDGGWRVFRDAAINNEQCPWCDCGCDGDHDKSCYIGDLEEQNASLKESEAELRAKVSEMTRELERRDKMTEDPRFTAIEKRLKKLEGHTKLK